MSWKPTYPGKNTMKKISGIERLQKHNESKKKTKKIDKIVKGVCIYWVTFIAIAWITFWVKDSVPDSLIQFGLGGGAVELLISGAIEIFRDFLPRRHEDGEIEEP